ncbi:AMP-binding protein [Streptomyces sp. NPDC050085]|uniref:AMP-binding protein n=1 Tax=Streptomyces sp. NPDC050085 TaxID=3365600 RepID=UPI00379D9E24
MASLDQARDATGTSVALQLRALAAVDPQAPALTWQTPEGPWRMLTREDLCRYVDAAVAKLAATVPGGIRATVIDLPNGAPFVVAVLASWWTGRTPLIVPSGSTPQEREALFARTNGSPPAPDISADVLNVLEGTGQCAGQEAHPIEDEPSESWCLPSGGSTGLPSLVPVQGKPSAVIAGQQLLLSAMGWHAASVQLVLGPLFHAAPFTSTFSGVAAGNHVVMPARFSPADLEEALDLAPPTWCQLTPHQMALIAADEQLMEVFSSRLEGIMHTAAPCPADVKQEWIDRIGPQRVFEMYGSTQMIGAAVSSGTEWLERPGTVGRPFMTQVRILDDNGRRLPPGTVGEVTMRSTGTRRLAPATASHVRTHPGGFYGVGDLGYLDKDGYLYLTDRLDDVMIIGGANVSAREIELTLLAHPDVREVIVCGRPNELMGETPHAVVACVPGSAPTIADLKAHCAARLASYKVPTSIELVPELARSKAGKIQRFRYSA